MICKRCGHDLPLVGYICTNCGAMMSIEQIQEQKKISPLSSQQSLISEKYGHKDFIYKKREVVKSKYKGLFLFLGIILGIIFIGILVYLG